jgi:hypothetical protein
MAAIHSNGGNRWNILGFNFTKRDALSSVYKISMMYPYQSYQAFLLRLFSTRRNFLRGAEFLFVL